jgi:aspartyl-tRNA(Asn)/glutamyl-tRNA(Gln) amidotransferase subunit C
MQINRDLIGHLANISRLHFSDEELLAMQNDLIRMTGFVEKLNELETIGVEPLMHMSSVQDIFRNDAPACPMEVSMALENAPVHNGNFFLVPKVIS